CAVSRRVQRRNMSVIRTPQAFVQPAERGLGSTAPSLPGSGTFTRGSCLIPACLGLSATYSLPMNRRCSLVWLLIATACRSKIAQEIPHQPPPDTKHVLEKVRKKY